MALFSSTRTNHIPHNSLRTQARQVSVVRFLLIALGFAVLFILTNGRKPEQIEPAASALQTLLIVTTVVGTALLSTMWLTRWRWQLALHLVLDIAWIGLLLFYSGGVASAGVVLLFIVVLVGALVLPGVIPFVLPSLGSLALAVVASLYLAGQVPFPATFLETNTHLTQTDRILGVLATQVAALFLVDLLAQLLTRRLREQRIFTGEVLDRLGEGVLAVDRQNTVAYANAEALRLLRLSGPVDGIPVQQLLGDEAVKPVLNLLLGETCPHLERIVTAEGKQLIVRVTALLDRKENLLGRTLIIADETRLRVLEENAHRADHLRALGEMAAGIAHEIRNPLTSLRGCAQELAEIAREAQQRDAASLADIMVGEADRLARIVEDFLSLSRLRTPELKSISLNELLSSVKKLMEQRRDLPAALRVQFIGEDVASTVMADEGQIRQVVINLINNAIDAVREVTTPQVSCELALIDALPSGSPQQVEIRVRDNGCGIPEEQREQIFTPFYSTKAQGTGLGLSLVQRIMREHDGYVQLTSEVGHGTTVTVGLPTHSHTRVFKRALGGH
jgi:two-component system, NtrC family, nitrogen regulation sensor histidine kinase GlnL